MNSLSLPADVNECRVNNGDCSQKCVNDLPDPTGILPGYHCECEVGDVLHPDGQTCIPSALCSVVNDTFQCSCRPGYQDNSGTGFNCTGREIKFVSHSLVAR